jgi:hypothetical protein
LQLSVAVVTALLVAVAEGVAACVVVRALGVAAARVAEGDDADGVAAGVWLAVGVAAARAAAARLASLAVACATLIIEPEPLSWPPPAAGVAVLPETLTLALNCAA